jgi:hypothetical protein
MLWGIPTVLREVKPPDERDGIIDHDQFFVLAGPNGMSVIEVKLQSPVGLPAILNGLEPLSFHRVEHGKIPVVNVYPQRFLTT